MNSLPLPSFIELLIKQTCRRASYEFEMGSKLSTENPPGIYSLEFLKSLYEKPRENIHRVLKNSDLKVPNGLNLMCSKEFSTVGFRRLLDFFNKVKDMSPPKSQNWIDLQHYMHYVYRNFVSANPDPTAEVLSSFFINEIKALVNSLRQEDESQLYLRVLALLREYCIFAQWNYSKTDGERCITKLFYYYEAMLSAAKNLNTVFSDFECILYKNYSICWIDFNTCVFINYFFETEFVKNKIYKCLETKVSPGDTLPMFGLLEDLKNLWIREQVRIITLHQESVIDDTNELYEQEEATVAAHKKLLSSNFWIERSENEINNLNLDRFDHQIFRLFGDPLFHPAGPILDRHGQCICEECLIAKYKCILDDNQDQFGDKLLKNVQRLSYCRMCQSLVDLESFHRHINSHAMSNLDNKLSMLTISSNLSRIISEKIDFVKLGNEPLNLPDVVSPEPTAPEDKSTFHPPPNKDPQPKLANEPPVFKNTFDSKYSNTSNEIDNTKFAFEEFLKHRKENATKNEHILNKNVRNFIKIKKDIFNHSNGNLAEKMFDDVLKATHIPVAQNSESPLENEVNKLREIRKNGHKPYPVTCKPATLVPKARCEHSCKHEVEAKPNICPGHTCDHHKESKKCECTYCEVFGTSVTSHSHKTNELRDKLRIRLHQRREKRTKDICKAPITAANANNPNRIKSTVNKVEERVPLPSSPTNIPPAPSVKLADSSTITSSTPHDIHGLLSYIEGHSVLNQLELAEKKAAKKARQRMKKEEERIKFEEEQRKLAEAIKRKEEEKKREIARLLAEKERAKALSEALTQKQIKKRAKKERQAQKKHLAQKPVCEERPAERGEVMEQTIPAMVTIKKSDNGDSAPKVTITLKGSTPDQDKLLHTLVKDSDNGNSENQNLNSTGAKKKKKKKQYNRLEPTVIAKELKVTLAVDSNRVNTQSKMMNKNIDEEIQAVETNEFKIEPTSHEDLDIPMLRLPPGKIFEMIRAIKDWYLYP